MTGGGVDRALADLVGGWEGPETLYELACLRLARQCREFGEEVARFRSHPRGGLHRLHIACQDALRTAELAVDLHEALDTGLPREDRAVELAGLLLARARHLADDRVGLGGAVAAGEERAGGLDELE